MYNNLNQAKEKQRLFSDAIKEYDSLANLTKRYFRKNSKRD